MSDSELISALKKRIELPECEISKTAQSHRPPQRSRGEWGMISIPIVFGWLRFHRKEQLCLCKKPWLVCHWNKAGWMKTDLYSKRLFCIGRDAIPTGTLDYFDPWFSR